LRPGAPLLALALCGCAALPWPSGGRRAESGSRTGPWLDLRGAVHVHTEVSHDSPGRIRELIAAAHGAGIRWIAFTEHVHAARSVPASGELEGVTLIPGWEVGVAGGSMLALGVDDASGLPRQPRALVREIHARGGAAFVGHIERSRLMRPEAWEDLDADGIELVNLHAAAESVRLRLGLGLLFLPARWALRALMQTPHEALAQWAQLPQARAIVGGVDAHAKFRALGALGGTLDRYRDVLRLLTTHVLARDATRDAVLEALREGRSYVAFEGLAPVEQFDVTLDAAGVRVRAPQPARLALVCRGQEIAAAADTAQALLQPRPGERHCHVEAWLGSQLWIATSRLAGAW
jgi:hypothetical protein